MTKPNKFLNCWSITILQDTKDKLIELAYELEEKPHDLYPLLQAYRIINNYISAMREEQKQQ